MGVRLNKVLTELNIGLQTAVDYLKKKNLGEINDATMNTKITDEQYNALVKEFKGDKDVKTQAGMMFPKKDKKAKPEHKSEPAVAQTKEEAKQTFTPLGKIDLSTVGKPNKPQEEKPKAPAAEQPKPEPKPQPKPEVKPEPKPEPVAPKPEPKSEPKPEQKVEVKPEPKPQPQPKEEVKPEPKAPVAEQPKAEQKPAETIFTLKSEKKMAPNFNVVGKIDLDSLNQSTRPKKKSKEERRKEREEKQAQMHNGEKKKRERIHGGKERVDIEAAANQEGGNKGGNNKKNKGGNQNFQDGGNQGGGKKNKKNRSFQKPLEVDDEAVARQVKETLARLTSKNQNKKGAKYRREKRDAVAERMNEEMAAEAAQSKVLKLTEFVTVSELATMMNVGVNQVIGTCMSIGIMVSINQRLDAETINIVAEEFGFTTEYVSAEVQNAITEEEDDENDLISRAPIVTVMGHVDHGKTSLLDHIRNTNVIAGEAGGITQHIGAYNVKLKDGRQITFLDTPGHEAFTAMRARGAQVTDIAIIIVAADDSVMPTTKEAIAHAQAANVPMVFAINKIDKPGANPDKIREDLANMNLLVEEWGGKYQCQEISAKKGIGVDELLEKVLLEAEMLDLKANPNRKATGSIIESSLDKGRGYVSTVLVSNGTLKVGDVVIAGTAWGKVKAMFNERNQRIDLPSQLSFLV